MKKKTQLDNKMFIYLFHSINDPVHINETKLVSIDTGHTAYIARVVSSSNFN